MIVVDSNILIYSLVDNERSQWAQRLKEKDAAWRFPALWWYEFGNALALMARKRELNEEAASEVLNVAQKSFALGEKAVNVHHAFRLTVGLGITFYDAQYLALAETLDVPLVTEDKALRRVSGGLAVSMEEFLR